MPEKIVILSGKIGSGKTTLADLLQKKFKVHLCKTRVFLKRRAEGLGLQSERRALQDFGERLDSETKGGWVQEELAKECSEHPDARIVALDSVRIQEQVEAVRKAHGRRLIHIHLDASEEELTSRYEHRQTNDVKELSSYAATQENETERKVGELAKIADVVIQTDRCTPEDVLVRVASHLGFYERCYDRLVDVLVGGQYGSEGKGQICAHLAPEYDLLIRVGGPNAGHKVHEDPTPYAFHQLPSGTRVSKANVLIGAGAVINEKQLLKEITDCHVPQERLVIDPQAMIIEPKDIEEEVELTARIGSTGQGVGKATARRIARGENVRLARCQRTVKTSHVGSNQNQPV